MSISFDRMLELVDGRSAAFRSALAGALDERVPGCPDWTGRDLIGHLGEVQRFWAAIGWTMLLAGAAVSACTDLYMYNATTPAQVERTTAM